MCLTKQLKKGSALFCLILSTVAMGFEVTSIQSEYNLIHDVQYIVSHDKSFDPRSLGAAKQKELFNSIPTTEQALNLGFVNGSVWVKITLNRSPTARPHWILEIPYLGLDLANLYLEDGQILKNGANVAVNQRPYFSRHYAFPVELSEQAKTFYLQVESSFPITIPLRIAETNNFNQTQFSENLFQALYYGGLLSLLFYNLVLFIIIKDKKYLLYSLFAAATGLGIFAGNGYGRMYLWQNSANWDQISQSTLLCMAGTFALQFTMRFLHASQTAPIANKLMGLMSLIYVVLAASFIFSLYLPISTEPIYLVFFILSLASPCVALYTSVRTVMVGVNSASFAILGWGVFCLGTVVATLRLLALIPNNTLTLYALQISSAIEMLLFAFALAHHFQAEQEQKTEIQKDLLKSKEEALSASRLSEERLEIAVNTRTEKLQHLLLSEQHIREQYVRFGAMIAHEFRNPLNIIGAQTTLLEVDLNTSPDKVLARTSVIHSAVTRLTRLFDQWLESDRLSHADNQIHVQPIKVNVWLKTLIDPYREYYSSHQIKINLQLHPVQILGDDHLLQIAILNLIENACKYSASNTMIEIGLKLDDYAIGIYVKDSGCGIPLQMQEKILEPYIRMDSSKETQGVGLGLAFVKRIMEAHDGRIEIRSQENIGSEITLWFPESIA